MIHGNAQMNGMGGEGRELRRGGRELWREGRHMG
jgi:hypothetical protein